MWVLPQSFDAGCVLKPSSTDSLLGVSTVPERESARARAFQKLSLYTHCCKSRPLLPLPLAPASANPRTESERLTDESLVLLTEREVSAGSKPSATSSYSHNPASEMSSAKHSTLLACACRG